VALVALLVAGAVGVYAYDSARSDEIAEGVTVGGVDVGGMTVEQARFKLREEIKKPLRQPIRVAAGGQRFTLPAKAADIVADLDGMVDDAVAASREGNAITRTVRGLSGGDLDRSLPSRVSYSRSAVGDLIQRIEGQVNRPPRDAQVQPAGAGLQKVPDRDGLALESNDLRRSLVAELESPDGDRRVRADTKRVDAEVTTGELAKETPHYLTIDRGVKVLRYYRHLKLAKTYPIAVGRAGFDTPSGTHTIQNKAVDPAWNVPEWGGRLAGQTIPGGAPNNPLKERWLGIYDGAGIHGTTETASLGTAASHGCIRMSIPEVIELYDKVPVGTPVYIE